MSTQAPDPSKKTSDDDLRVERDNLSVTTKKSRFDDFEPDMSDVEAEDAKAEEQIAHISTVGKTIRWIGVALLFYSLLISIEVIGDGFKLAAGGRADELFDFATNPLVGLLMGILVTTLIQSSSTTTSIIVGLVAGGLPVGIAVPMIMGANIGTTLTNTLASLGTAGNPKQFRRAFHGATVHDFFNLFAVIIFLPIEVVTGVMENMAGWLAGLFRDSSGAKSDSPLDAILDPPVKAIVGGLENMPFGEIGNGVVIAVLGAAGILLVIAALGKVLGSLMVGAAKRLLQNSIGRGPVAGIGSGAAVTILAQSSSVTTSLMVPFVAAGTLSVRQVYPYTLGANVGTTFTALLASMAVSGDTASAALQIAFVHLLFNIFGILVIYCIPFLRPWPLRGSGMLAEAATKNKFYVVAWVLGVYIIIPLIAVGLVKLFQ